MNEAVAVNEIPYPGNLIAGALQLFPFIPGLQYQSSGSPARL